MRHITAALFTGFFAVGALMIPGIVLADGIGMIKVSSGDVMIERSGHQEAGKVGSVVYQSDKIVTGKDGTAGITFIDNSMLSLGPNSSLGLEQFKFNTTTHEGSFDISLKKGTLSAIAGKLTAQNPDSMKIRTPASILAVRGTELVIKVDGD